MTDTHQIDLKIAQMLSERADVCVRFDLTGRDISTFAIGGPLRAFVEVGSVTGLAFLLKVLTDNDISFALVGNGSNLLVADAGVSCWLIHLTGEFRAVERAGSTPTESANWIVGAAYSLMTLSRETANQGFGGLAFAGGIPATVGGAICINAGAHHGEMSQVIQWVEVLGASRSVRRMQCSELGFSYRHSLIGDGEIVIRAGLVLPEVLVEDISRQRAECLEERRARQPLTVPSAGSVFKNPSRAESAGWMLEQCGLKGYRIGDISVSEKHANWIVNPSKLGKADDVNRLIMHCQETVNARFGIGLEAEIISIG